MAKDALHGVTNVEIKAKPPCAKPLVEQLEIMEEYTRTYKAFESEPKDIREAACLRVLYPRLFREIEPGDLFVGRFDTLPIGFGSVTSLGGVGHYCVFGKLSEFKEKFKEKQLQDRVSALEDFWLKKDLRSRFLEEYLDEKLLGFFNEDGMAAPLIAGVRLSGMMLDYNKLVRLGIEGLEAEIRQYQKQAPDNSFYQACLSCLELFRECCDTLKQQTIKTLELSQDQQQKKDLTVIIESLSVIRSQPPKTFHQAIQLVWLYAILGGIINYGRLDDVVGSFLKHDLENGVIDEETAYRYVKNLWWLIENKRTTVNGRVIVGGRGRHNPKAADLFVKLALRVCKECRYVEPQFTLRLYKDTSAEIFDMAMDCLASGATYPTLYNDEVNVPAVMAMMGVDEKTAEQYVPFGCGEFTLVGMAVGTPNVCLNVAKTLALTLTQGYDPYDGVDKSGPVIFQPLEKLKTFEAFYGEYRKLHDYYCQLSADAQITSFKFQKQSVSYLFDSILTNDCLSRGKAILDGGVRYLGGCNETYGNTNCADGLYAIKKLVFEDHKYTLLDFKQALLNDYVGYEALQRDILRCAKYGNDIKEVDEIAVQAYNDLTCCVKEAGRARGLDFFGIVIINNMANTTWGNKTAATPDGRKAHVYLAPSNNPQGGADKNGPTAMLNSLLKLDPKQHLGAVQNIKFQKTFFQENLDKIKLMFQTYFKNGGCQLMVTVIDSGALQDALVHPEKYPDLIVRVSGFSAVFVELDRNVQTELLSRTLYDGA
ncbi:MAG: pyruvate formate lyase family protein [Erysipelotrichaceae bacterium]|jgi:pyruvate-formate lyase|nr:pyruvate formate lyase family protein [Erysipelotrichaceae bacterium]